MDKEFRKSLDDYIRVRLNEKRYRHTTGVVYTALRLAQRYGADPDKTETAALFHDACKNLDIDEMNMLVEQYQVDELVMGFPRNMDGTEGPWAELYRAFAQQVEEATGLRPVLWDERRTTIDAHRILFDAGKNARKRKKTVDAVAASLILEGYLTFRKTQTKD